MKPPEPSRVRVKVVETARERTAMDGWYGAHEMTESIAELARHAGAAHVEITREADGRWKLAATGARGEVIIKASGLGGPRPTGRPINPEIRGAVIKRDGATCAYCGEKDGPIHIDHVLAVANGGTDELDNLVVACAACNISKGDRLVEEWFTRRFQGQRALIGNGGAKVDQGSGVMVALRAG